MCVVFALRPPLKDGKIMMIGEVVRGSDAILQLAQHAHSSSFRHSRRGELKETNIAGILTE